MGLKPSGLDSTHPIAVCMVGSPEAKSREVAISDVLLPDGIAAKKSPVVFTCGVSVFHAFRGTKAVLGGL